MSTLTPEEIAKRLKLDEVTTDELKEAVDATTDLPKPEEKEKDILKDPRATNPYPFEFNWTDSRGKVWTGHFRVHYPTPLDLLKAGSMQSRLLGGAPKESLDVLTDEIAFIVSRLSFCLDEKPGWFKDPLSIVDGVPLLQAVYAEVYSFENFFREHGNTESRGAKEHSDE
jgi:hypothetical protein